MTPRPRETYTVGIDGRRDIVATFKTEQEAMDFAHFDHQLTGHTAVVVRWEGNGRATLLASFYRQVGS